MVVSQTSLKAYMDLITNPVLLNANQRIVLDVFEKLCPNQPLSNFDLSLILEWPINRVTPRVLELRTAGKLVHVGYKTQLQTGKRVMLWMATWQWDGMFIDINYGGCENKWM